MLTVSVSRKHTMYHREGTVLLLPLFLIWHLKTLTARQFLWESNYFCGYLLLPHQVCQWPLKLRNITAPVCFSKVMRRGSTCTVPQIMHITCSFFHTSHGIQIPNVDQLINSTGLFLVAPHSKSSQFAKQCDLLCLFASISVQYSGQTLNPKEIIIYSWITSGTMSGARSV